MCRLLHTLWFGITVVVAVKAVFRAVWRISGGSDGRAGALAQLSKFGCKLVFLVDCLRRTEGG